MVKARIYYTLGILITALLLSVSSAAQPAAYAQQPSEQSLYAQEQLLSQFLRHKTALAVQNTRTHRDQYNAIAFASFPRVFYEDRIEAISTWAEKGALYRSLARQIYEDLRASTPINAREQAGQVMAYISLHPRRVAVAQALPLPQKGDIWHQAFSLTSYYEQLGSFVAHPQRLQLDTQLFQKRQEDIEKLLTQYTTQSYQFISQVLVPLQRDFIAKADAASLVRRHLASVQTDVDKEALARVLLENVPTQAQCYQQAEKLDPSFAEQLLSLAKVLHPRLVAGKEDWSKVLGLFEYISVGTLIQRLQRFGHIPSRREALDDLAGSIAAAALNKSVAQIANDLMEFEKPFYYALHSFHGKEELVGAHWHRLATNEKFYSYKIAQLATANLLDSGRRAYQDLHLESVLQQRRIDKNVNLYDKYAPFVLDVAATDAVFSAAVPLVWTRLVEKVKVKKALNYALKQQRSRALAAVKALPRTATQIERDLAGVYRVTRISDGAERAVFKLETVSGRNYFIKWGTREELARTKQLDELVTSLKLREKYPLIEFEYPKIVSERLDPLPKHVQTKMLRQIQDPYLKTYVRDYDKRVQVPFIMTEIDTQGVLLIDALDDPKVLHKVFGRRKISREQFNQMAGLVNDLENAGLPHGDLFRNMSLMPIDEPLHLAIWDYESFVIRSDRYVIKVWKTLLENNHYLR